MAQRGCLSTQGRPFGPYMGRLGAQVGHLRAQGGILGVWEGHLGAQGSYKGLLQQKFEHYKVTGGLNTVS